MVRHISVPQNDYWCAMIGLASLVEKQNPNIVRTHWFLHREVFFSKITQNELKEVLSQVIETVNFIKTRPLKLRVFELLLRIWILIMFDCYCLSIYTT